MPYTINKTNNDPIVVITDGTVDNTTSLSLFGKSYSGFGELLNEDLVKLLENSAYTSAPVAPLRGELWFDVNTNILKVYDGSSFKPVGGSKSASAAPGSPAAGDLWTDSDDGQLYVYTGGAWKLVGPVYTSGQTQSGWLIETLASAGGNKVVSSMYAGGIRVCILSKETFDPTVTQSGFDPTIYSGLTLNSTLGAVFEGTNTQASYVNVASGTAVNSNTSLIRGADFVRADESDDMLGQLTIDSDLGLRIGDAQELTVTVSSNNVTVAQTSLDKNLKFTVNDGGVTKTPLQLTGADGGIDMVGDLTITGNLNVSGAYNYTESEIVQHADAFLKVNVGGGDIDAGLIVETPDTNDARLFWDQSEDYWTAGYNNSYSQVIRIADAVADGNAAKEKVLKTSAAGLVTVTNVSLAAVGSAITTGDTSSVSVPTIGQVATFGNLWGGSAKTVTTNDPTGGVDGDIHFKYVN